jgi:hypothetical protein
MGLSVGLPELMRLANQAGVEFRITGGGVRVTAPPSPGEGLRAVLDSLKAHKQGLWELLGGSERERPSISVLADLEVEPIVPTTADDAVALIAEMEADSDANTPAELLSRGGLMGLDIETAANPGEETRPPVKLRLRDGLPAKGQHALSKEGAGLDPHRAVIRTVLTAVGSAAWCWIPGWCQSSCWPMCSPAV